MWRPWTSLLWAAVLDLVASRRADSFDKLWRDVAWLLARYTRLP